MSGQNVLRQNMTRKETRPVFPYIFGFSGNRRYKVLVPIDSGSTLFVPPRTARPELPARRNSIFQKTDIDLAQKLLGPKITRGVSSAAGL